MEKLEHNMILSASGWRKVFAISGNEKDITTQIGKDNEYISALSASVFADYIKNKTKKENPIVVLGMDTRPTGKEIANAMIKALSHEQIQINFIGITAAPEIMAYSKKFDGFIYISASHNPIGHNGIKFGLSDGGVLEAKENSILIDDFLNRCNSKDELHKIEQIVNNKIPNYTDKNKIDALNSYKEFSKEVISSITDTKEQNQFFEILKTKNKENPIGIVCDMNGSARSASIDKIFFAENNLNFYPFNDIPGKIVHEIIPEPENLVHCAKKMEELQSNGVKDAILGYMPDCDGDRGNIVYWDSKEKKAKVLKAQEVFSLSVLAELAFSYWLNESKKEQTSIPQNEYKPAIAVNCPTSMRIDEIASHFNAKVFRAEVGEANVVNTARLARNEGYTVRILGEGSNGGTITYPSSVRDPINTIFAFVKLLTIRDESLDKTSALNNGTLDNSTSLDNATFDKKQTDNSKTQSTTIKPGLFHIWCNLSKQLNKYTPDFTLQDIIDTLPVYTTTGVSEPRAILKVATLDQAKLKGNFQKVFEESWKKDSQNLLKKYGILSYKCIITNGTKETIDVTDFSASGKGGLKIQFFENSETPTAFIWMRGSGTEPVFRIMCDVKGDNSIKEKELLEWETLLLQEADKLSK